MTDPSPTPAARYLPRLREERAALRSASVSSDSPATPGKASATASGDWQSRPAARILKAIHGLSKFFMNSIVSSPSSQ